MEHLQTTEDKREFLSECYIYLAKSQKKLNDWTGVVNSLREACSYKTDDTNTVVELGIE